MILPTPTAPETPYLGMLKAGSLESLQNGDFMGSDQHPTMVLFLAETAGLDITAEIAAFRKAVHKKARALLENKTVEVQFGKNQEHLSTAA